LCWVKENPTSRKKDLAGLLTQRATGFLWENLLIFVAWPFRSEEQKTGSGEARPPQIFCMKACTFSKVVPEHWWTSSTTLVHSSVVQSSAYLHYWLKARGIQAERLLPLCLYLVNTKNPVSWKPGLTLFISISIRVLNHYVSLYFFYKVCE
jgi:hypothetical protein